MVINQNNTKKVYFFRGTRSVLGDNSEKIPNKLKKKVICKETQIIYNSTTEAANAVGVFPSNITNCAKNKRRTAGGYHWEYVK